MDHDENDGNYDDEETKVVSHGSKKSNILPLWGNERTMNLNALILTNIQSSHYFKVNLYELKTYHEVIDEIYYKVSHLEPWEKGSRKTAGQTGMCGGVRGVGAGGIVSTAYCLLYKLFTLKLTRKQVNGLITHPDSSYIRALGFMYIRYTQPPADLWDWYDEYLEDPEEMDVKAGGGQIMTIGNILKNFLCKLEWFSTLFPRIPVPIQQKLEKKMNERFPPAAAPAPAAAAALTGASVRKPADSTARGDADRDRSVFRDNNRGSQHDDRDKKRYSRERDRDGDRNRSRVQSRDRDGDRDRSRVQSRDRDGDRDRSRVQSRDRDGDRDRSRVPSRDRDGDRDRSRVQSRERDGDRDRSRLQSRDRDGDRDRSRVPSRDRNGDRDRSRLQSRDRDGDRDRSRVQSRDRDGDRDRSRLQSRDRDGDRDRERDRKDRDYDRDRRDRDRRERDRKRDSPVRRGDKEGDRRRTGRESPSRRGAAIDERRRERESVRYRSRY